jgi:hypothetical protein
MCALRLRVSHRSDLVIYLMESRVCVCVRACLGRHWYLSQGLPTVVGPGLMLPVTMGLALCWRAGSAAPARPLALIIMLIVAMYSTQPHKEFRFILSVLPLLAVFAGHGLSYLEGRPDDDGGAGADGSRPPRRPNGAPASVKAARARAHGHWAGRVARATLLLNAPLALYFGRWHQAGPISCVWSAHCTCVSGFWVRSGVGLIVGRCFCAGISPPRLKLP